MMQVAWVQKSATPPFASVMPALLVVLALASSMMQGLQEAAMSPLVSVVPVLPVVLALAN
jgi:hypothetical protein